MSEVNTSVVKNITAGKTVFIYVFILSLLLNPAVGLFVGIAIAQVNWWKLNMRNKILPYTATSVTIGFFANWVGNSHIDDNSIYTLILLFLGILVVNIFAFHLWKQMDRDIMLFQAGQKELSESPQWKGATYFFTPLILWLLLMFGLNSLARSFGYCQFPTLPDIAGRVADDNRDGMGKLVMRFDDFGCDWNFDFQRSETPDTLFTSATASDSYSRTIFIEYFNKSPLSFTNSDIDHYVWVETNLQVFEKIRKTPDRYDNFAEKTLELPVIQLTPEPDVMRVTCDGYDDDEDIYCSVKIVRGDIISVLNFDASNLPPDEFWRLFNAVILNTDRRIQEYQAGVSSPSP